MKNIYTLFFILIFFNACSKKEDSTQNILSKESNSSKEAIEKIESFLFVDIKTRELNITMKNNRLIAKQIKQPLILFNLFSSKCRPCMGQIPYLNEIQRIYQDDLFVVGLLIPDSKGKKEVAKEMKESGISYFISYSKDSSLFLKYIHNALELPEKFSIPLLVLYRDGELYRYYEGAVPMEMLEIEIKNARKSL